MSFLFVFSVNFILSVLLDIVVLFYAARFFRVPRNSAQKALIITVIASLFGFFIGDVLIKLILSPFLSLLLLFAPLVLITVIFIRLFIIKFVYRISFSKSFIIWILSAVVSVLVSRFLPF